MWFPEGSRGTRPQLRQLIDGGGDACLLRVPCVVDGCESEAMSVVDGSISTEGYVLPTMRFYCDGHAGGREGARELTHRDRSVFGEAVQHDLSAALLSLLDVLEAGVALPAEVRERMRLARQALALLGVDVQPVETVVVS